MMKKVAITMGEPGGIGPEVALKAISGLEGKFIPIIIGDIRVLSEMKKLLGLKLKLRAVTAPVSRAERGILQVLDIGGIKGFVKGKPSKAGGEASALCIKLAVQLAMEGLVDSIVTAPISKEALKKAGYKWPGHTEMLAELTNTKDYRMMLMADSGKRRLRVMLVTIHVALRDVQHLITKQKVLMTIRLALSACEMLSIKSPKIAVSGLNPHAGEGGIMGDEEMNIIAPAVKAAIKEGLPVSGPYPPDTVYHRAYEGHFDIVVSMYHDQGLIPLKLIGFDNGVNVTVGLPFVRTSPDHGTAYDIAWKGMANPSSMIEAIKTALTLKIK